MGALVWILQCGDTNVPFQSEESAVNVRLISAGAAAAVAGALFLSISGETDAGDPPRDVPPAQEVIARSSFEAPFTWGPSVPPGAEGSWWQWPEEDENVTHHAEEGIPGGPSFIRTRYPVGLPPGRAPVNWGGWNEGASQQGDEYERIRFSQHLRFVDRGSGDWESQRVGTKIGFFGVGSCRGSNAELYLFLEGGTSPRFTVSAVQQGPVSRRMRQNRYHAPVIEVGRWHHLELEMALNELGWPNGLLRWWVDGRLVMEHRDVVFRTGDDPCGFSAYKWNPTWGGTGGPPKAREDYIDISEIRISGRPLRR